MSAIATATLQTPWDCKWSRFGRMHSRGPHRPAEGLWVCLHDNARRPIDASECETCPYWEYEPPRESVVARPNLRSGVQAPAVAACPRPNRAERRIEIGARIAAFALAVLLAGMGFVVLTGPLAIPLTISLWMGAVTSFLFGMWGNFNRRLMPPQSW
jgi:hypothetical protein